MSSHSLGSGNADYSLQLRALTVRNKSRCQGISKWLMICITHILNILWFYFGRQWAINANSIHLKGWVWWWCWCFGWRNCLLWPSAISQWLLCMMLNFLSSASGVLPFLYMVQMGPGSQHGQQESGIFKLHQMSPFAVYGAVFGLEILSFDARRNKMATTCEVTRTI